MTPDIVVQNASERLEAKVGFDKLQLVHVVHDFKHATFYDRLNTGRTLCSFALPDEQHPPPIDSVPYRGLNIWLKDPKRAFDFLFCIVERSQHLSDGMTNESPFVKML